VLVEESAQFALGHRGLEGPRLGLAVVLAEALVKGARKSADGRLVADIGPAQPAAREPADVLAEFREAGKLILGICTGFQVLIKSGILLQIDPHAGPAATLTNNESGKFEDRWVNLRVTSTKCVLFAGIEEMYLPVAHAEGRFVPRDDRLLAKLHDAGQLVLRYAHEGVDATEAEVPYPANPNGSAANVAGVCDATGRVCGLMPHPERHIDATHHPRWTRRSEQPPHGDGFRVFQNAVAYFR
jgi:phosphoribosylformylglycinamidine synthase